MMTSLRPMTAVLAAAIAAAALGDWADSRADDRDSKYQLNLADLPGYRAALEGKPTADGAKASDAPVQVRFRDVWNQRNTFLGRRVIVKGRVERIFRQAAVGQFPALAEVWIMSPVGDPFCVVFAQPEPITGNDPRSQKQRPDTKSENRRHPDSPPLIPDVGQTVRFTGTFLKMVSYAASDGKRLAPLIVGERPPLKEPDGVESAGAATLRDDSAEVVRTIGGRQSKSQYDRWPWWGANGALALAMAALAGGIMIWQHLKSPVRRHHRLVGQHEELPKPDEPPVEFIN
jgi:hypothetical protein